jgi:hypothetical protein
MCPVAKGVIDLKKKAMIFSRALCFYLQLWNSKCWAYYILLVKGYRVRPNSSILPGTVAETCLRCTIDTVILIRIDSVHGNRNSVSKTEAYCSFRPMCIHISNSLNFDLKRKAVKFGEWTTSCLWLGGCIRAYRLIVCKERVLVNRTSQRGLHAPVQTFHF